VLERIGRIKERNSAIAKYYLINVIKDAEGKNAIDINWEASDIAKQEFNFPVLIF